MCGYAGGGGGCWGCWLGVTKGTVLTSSSYVFGTLSSELWNLVQVLHRLSTILTNIILRFYWIEIETLELSPNRIKDATQVNFSQKTALSTLRRAILTIKHLFIPKNEVSKLFENFNFYTMFMC